MVVLQLQIIKILKLPTFDQASKDSFAILPDMNLLLFLLPFANTADPSFYAALSLPAGKLPAGTPQTPL